MGKGEIAHYEQFLLFPQCFQKACFQGASKGVIVWEWVNVNLIYDGFQNFITKWKLHMNESRKLPETVRNTS